jgi:hypothetical protein
MGSEDEVKSMLDQIDAEDVPPPEPAPQLETEPEPPEAASRLKMPKLADGIKLLEYLMSLAASLPENKRKEYAKSEYPLKIEAVKNILKGKQGLRRDFSEKPNAPPPAAAESVTREKVKKSLGFVVQLADYLPNQDVKTALREKLKAISDRLSQGEGGAHR